MRNLRQVLATAIERLDFEDSSINRMLASDALDVATMRSVESRAKEEGISVADCLKQPRHKVVEELLLKDLVKHSDAETLDYLVQKKSEGTL